jgi:hypothetical protein
LAGFLVYSALAHLALIAFLFCVGRLAGLLHCQSLSFLRTLPFLPIPELSRRVISLPASSILIYLPLSFFSGWAIGFARGLLTVWRPFTLMAGWLGIDDDSRAGKLWLRMVGRFLLAGRPIIYDALFPEEDETGKSKLVFVELVLKDNGGTYIGQVEAFSITRDEEEHKLLYMIDVYRRENTDSSFRKLAVDGMLIDLSEVVTLSVLQMAD